MNAPVVGFVGMTHLGLCSAVAAASTGFVTRAFDRDAALVARLAAGELPVMEPGLDDLLRENRARIRFSADAGELGACDLVYVAPDVPTDGSGQSNLSALDGLLEFTLVNTRPGAVVVVLSQVPPGYTRARQQAGRSLFYQVETLIFGRAVERATKPERFIVGCLDPAQPLPAVLDVFLQKFHCPILPMRFESAELCKIAINCCLVSSISVANTLAELCEGIGAVWSEIVPALKLDRRIGQFAYLVPGLGIAGGNLERDLATVCRLAQQIGSDDAVVRAWLSNSRHRRDWALRILQRTVLQSQQDPLIAVLGLAYKENTYSPKNSQSVVLIGRLSERRIVAHDPVVPVSATGHPTIRGASSALECVRDADVLLIMTPWPQYRSLDPAALARVMRGNIVIDPYAVLDLARCRDAGLAVHRLGEAEATL